MDRCIVCGHSISYKLFNPGPQPLAALNLPHCQEEALDAIRHPMHFNACAICGHVWNTGFEYARVPYAGDSNLMYNSGMLWRTHMQLLIDKLAENYLMWIDHPIIDIGCGDGLFFSQLLETIPTAKCIGFEPGIEGDKITDFECVRDYFIPERDLKRLQPSLLVCRHVIEHLENPRDFVADIAYWCGQYGLDPVFLAEVPCFDKALETGRISDFLYEHASNFTLNSLYTLFSTSGFQLLEVSCLYDEEVAVGVFQPHNVALNQHCQLATAFDKKVARTFENVEESVSQLRKSSSVVLWGGTGKSAAFLNMFDLNYQDFPLVVDSDEHKVGRYVPGTGQKIQSPDILIGRNPTIIITTAWRAKDIYSEIQMRGLQYKQILVLKDGVLNEYIDIS
jgi:hypothetical protein